MRGLFLLLLFAIQCSLIQAQKAITKKITTDDGLPSSEVYSIIQDRDGFIWIGTDNGLAKFDGKSFVNYTTKEGLPDNAILDIFEDVNGTIWVSSMSNKISCIKNGKIEPYNYTVQFDTINVPLRSPFVRGADKTGRLWMNCVFTSLILKEVKPNTFKPIVSPLHLNNEGSNISYIIKEIGKEPFNSSDVVYQYQYAIDAEKFEVERHGDFLHLTGPFVRKSEPIDVMWFFRISNGDFLGISPKGAYILFNQDSIFTQGRLDVPKILNFYEDKDNNYWVVTQKGAFMFPNRDFEAQAEVFLDEFMITDMLQDREGNYWFTDHNYGMYKLSNINFRQLNLTGKPDLVRTASLKTIGDKLWFSTIDGEVWSMNKSYQALKIYTDDRPTYDFYPFEVLENNVLWLPGGRRYDQGKIIKNSAEIESTYNNDKSIIQLGNQLYVGTTQGISRFSLDGNCTYRSDKALGKNQFFKLRTNAIVEDGKGLWIGCIEGLYYMQSDEFQYVGENVPILRNRIMAMKEDANKERLIIGTKGEGVILFDKSTKKVSQITTFDGLISNMVRSIFVFGNKIYVGTNLGLSVLQIDRNMKSVSIVNFDIHNGLPSNEISDINFFNNQLWLATNRGIVYFDPAKLVANSYQPPIFLQKVFVNDSLTPFGDSTLKLGSNQRRIVFSYNGIGFRSGNRIQYKYFLSDFDQDTTFTQNISANYTNITPGEHTFFVWARNEDGFWSQNPAMLTITIPKKFTETIWFIGFLTIGILGLITSVFVITYRRKRSKLGIELQTAELKQQALAALMNPHFVYNSLAAIQHFINTDNIEKSNLYLSRFARLVRQNLNSVRHGFILLEDEIDRLKLYLEIEKMRFGDKLQYAVVVDEDIDLTGLEIPSMILQPFVENSIWHGILPMNSPGEIKVTFKMEQEDVLEVYIEDNGPGIDKSSKNVEKEHHTSLSMQITRERLALLGKKTGRLFTIQVREPETGSGMMVYVRIPLIID